MGVTGAETGRYIVSIKQFVGSAQHALGVAAPGLELRGFAILVAEKPRPRVQASEGAGLGLESRAIPGATARIIAPVCPPNPGIRASNSRFRSTSVDRTTYSCEALLRPAWGARKRSPRALSS